ncbi:integrating conjugative element protein [Alcaligenes faecalis]|nr:integrating conjugative element protein [Alcaligenes faecalis]
MPLCSRAQSSHCEATTANDATSGDPLMGMNNAQLGSNMREAFAAGSGVDPNAMKVVLTIITVAVVVLFFAWLVMTALDNYREGQLKQEEVVWACVKLVVLLSLILWVLV